MARKFNLEQLCAQSNCALTILKLRKTRRRLKVFELSDLKCLKIPLILVFSSCNQLKYASPVHYIH